MHAVLQAKMPRWLACTSSSIIIQQESNKPINQSIGSCCVLPTRTYGRRLARTRARGVLVATVPRPQHANAMQQILVLRIECFSVNFCGLWFNSLYRSTSRGTNTYIPFCKVEGFKLLYPRRHRREGRSPGQGFTASLLLSCMLTQLVFFGSCCMPTVIVNYSLQSKT